MTVHIRKEKACLFQDSAGAIPTKMIHWMGFTNWAISIPLTSFGYDARSRHEPDRTLVLISIPLILYSDWV